MLALSQETSSTRHVRTGLRPASWHRTYRFLRALVRCWSAVIGPLSMDCRWIVDGLCDGERCSSWVRGVHGYGCSYGYRGGGLGDLAAEGRWSGCWAGEKFAPDLFTGTGTFSVPVAVPAGRAGVAPGLMLTYSTGHGNAVFVGWAGC